jgi:hypothetical protein
MPKKAKDAEELQKQADLMNVETDAQIAVAEAEKEELALAEKLKEQQEVEATPDMPTLLPKRWGDSRRLTFASPGTIQRDPFYIPETVETNESGVRRRVAKHQWINGQLHVLTHDGRGKFRWTNPSKIGIQKRYGFRFASYDGLFKGTGLFEKRDGDTIWNGDVVLMWIPMAAWEKKCQQTKELKDYLEGSYGSDFFQASQDRGVPSFQDDMQRGVREFMT